MLMPAPCVCWYSGVAAREVMIVKTCASQIKPVSKIAKSLIADFKRIRAGVEVCDARPWGLM